MKEFGRIGPTLLAAWLAAAGAVGAAEKLQQIGRWHMGPVYASAISGDHLYFGSGGRIRVLETTGTFWREVGGIDTPGIVRDLFVSAGRLYAADESGWLRIFDLKTPLAPVALGMTKLNRPTRAVFVRDNLAYTASGWSGLGVVDVSDPSRPRVLGYHKTTGYSVDVHVDGGTAYVASNAKGLYMFDVSDPDAPQASGSIAVPGLTYGVFARNGTAYVVGLDEGETEKGGLRIYDVSNPRDPKQISFHELEYGAERIQVELPYAYIAGVANDAGLIVVDVSDPAKPKGRGTYTHPTCSESVTVAGTRAFLAHGDMGLEIIDITQPAKVPVVQHLDAAGLSRGIFVSGNRAYLANGYTGLRVIDVADPAAPRELGHERTYRALAVDVVDDVAYVADDTEGLRIVSVAKPSAPRRLARLDLPGESHGIDVAGGRAHIAAGERGLRVVDVSDPTAPQTMKFMETSGYAWDVVVSGELAYVADGTGGLVIAELSGDAGPRRVGRFVPDKPDVRGVAVHGTTVFLAAGGQGLIAVDAEDPAAPTEVGRIDTPRAARDVFVADGSAWVADTEWVRQYDVTNPARPQLVAEYMTPSYAKRLFVVDGTVFVAADQAGLIILKRGDSSAARTRVAAAQGDHLEALKRAAESADAPALAKMRYARMLLTRPVEGQDASRTARIALKHLLTANKMTGYNEPVHLETLSMAYAKLGKRSKAIKVLKVAIDNLPEHSASRRAEYEARLAKLEDR